MNLKIRLKPNVCKCAQSFSFFSLWNKIHFINHLQNIKRHTLEIIITISRQIKMITSKIPFYQFNLASFFRYSHKYLFYIYSYWHSFEHKLFRFSKKNAISTIKRNEQMDDCNAREVPWTYSNHFITNFIVFCLKMELHKIDFYYHY